MCAPTVGMSLFASCLLLVSCIDRSFGFVIRQHDQLSSMPSSLPSSQRRHGHVTETNFFASRCLNGSRDLLCSVPRRNRRHWVTLRGRYNDNENYDNAEEDNDNERSTTRTTNDVLVVMTWESIVNVLDYRIALGIETAFEVWPDELADMTSLCYEDSNFLPSTATTTALSSSTTTTTTTTAVAVGEEIDMDLADDKSFTATTTTTTTSKVTTTTDDTTKATNPVISSWLYNKLAAMASIFSSNDSKQSVVCDYAMATRLLLEEQVLDQGESTGKRGKYASKYHPRSSSSSAGATSTMTTSMSTDLTTNSIDNGNNERADGKTDGNSNADMNGGNNSTSPTTLTTSTTTTTTTAPSPSTSSTASSSMRETNYRRQRPLTVGEMMENWNDIIKETLPVRYPVYEKNKNEDDDREGNKNGNAIGNDQEEQKSRNRRRTSRRRPKNPLTALQETIQRLQDTTTSTTESVMGIPPLTETPTTTTTTTAARLVTRQMSSMLYPNKRSVPMLQSPTVPIIITVQYESDWHDAQFSLNSGNIRYSIAMSAQDAIQQMTTITNTNKNENRYQPMVILCPPASLSSAQSSSSSSPSFLEQLLRAVSSESTRDDDQNDVDENDVDNNTAIVQHETTVIVIDNCWNRLEKTLVPSLLGDVIPRNFDISMTGNNDDDNECLIVENNPGDGMDRRSSSSIGNNDGVLFNLYQPMNKRQIGLTRGRYNIEDNNNDNDSSNWVEVQQEQQQQQRIRPRQKTKSRHVAYVSLNLADWASHPTQHASATMNPWTNSLSWDDLDLLAPPDCFQ